MLTNEESGKLQHPLLCKFIDVGLLFILSIVGNLQNEDAAGKFQKKKSDIMIKYRSVIPTKSGTDIQTANSASQSDKHQSADTTMASKTSSEATFLKANAQNMNGHGSLPRGDTKSFLQITDKQHEDKQNQVSRILSATEWTLCMNFNGIIVGCPKKIPLSR